MVILSETKSSGISHRVSFVNKKSFKVKILVSLVNLSDTKSSGIFYWVSSHWVYFVNKESFKVKISDTKNYSISDGVSSVNKKTFRTRILVILVTLSDTKSSGIFHWVSSVNKKSF